MTAWAELTPLQADAVIATAIHLLLDPDELAEELVPLLREAPGPSSAGTDSTVKDSLTPASEPPTTYAITFTTAPPSTWSPS